jgi:dipeptidyl aminopeptidase/acylaminoacyl peptidase
MRIASLVPALAVVLALPLVAQSGRRPIQLDDLYRLRTVSDPQISPDGDWVAYTVSTPDTAEDRSDDDVWMTRWDGTRSVRLTWGKESEHTPRWSPDGRYLAFLSGRGDENDVDQLWLLDRAGGEARRLTSLKGGVTDYAWAPDARRLALVVEDPDDDTVAVAPDSTGGAPGTISVRRKTPKPIVVDRFQFKRDVDGYLGTRRQHLYLLHLSDRAAADTGAAGAAVTQLTTGRYDELLPSWSPDGRRIAFVSKRGPDVDRTDDWNVYAMEAAAGSAPVQLTTFEGEDDNPDWGSRPAWSPDGRQIAYVQGGEPRLIYYGVQKLAIVPAAGCPRGARSGGTGGGCAPRMLTATLDRTVGQPHWSPDGRSIWLLLEDDRTYHLARIPAAGGTVERVVGGARYVSAFDVGKDGRVAVLTSTPDRPYEVYAVTTGSRESGVGSRAAGPDSRVALRPLSRQNDAWLAGISLGRMEPTDFKSADGTSIGGFVVMPPDYQSGRRYPTVLRIHGGPVWQFYHEFQFDWQLLAAHGFVVVGANPRGSSGRGEAFSTAIYADWGNKDAQDVLAAVDDAVRRGIADSTRLAVGGWSYGGILTNYVIAQDARFKAATSGAGISNILAGYGTDQYVREYEHELGTPWKNADVWLKLSSPFLHADRIVTPTLFLCGEKDFNVPLLNSEQMYQALRSLGRETQLVIYPGQYHEITKPSYQRDRLRRYVDWYGKYLAPRAVGQAGSR